MTAGTEDWIGLPGCRARLPPRGRADIRCTNCAGTWHSWRSCQRLELPKDQRPCLLCTKTAHLAADCPNKPALALESGAPVAAASQSLETAQRSFEIRVAEAEGAEKRVRGRPVEIVSDVHGFNLVRGGFCPQPRGAQRGDFCAAAHYRVKNQGSTRRDVPFSFSKMDSGESQPGDAESTDERLQVRPGSVEGLSPGAWRPSRAKAYNESIVENKKRFNR